MIINCDSDRFVKEVIEGNEYSFAFQDLVVLDIGCNIGTFSFWIYKLAKEIYAIDIIPEIIDKLNKTIQENKLDKIKTFKLGITESTIPRKIGRDWNSDGGGSKIMNTIVTSEDEMVPCTTLGHFMEDNNIPYADIVKIDIEGSEGEAIGAADFPKDKIHMIIGERHLDPKYGYNAFIPLKDRLESMGFWYHDYGHHFIAKKRRFA